MNVNKIIKRHFKIREKDTLPYVGRLKSTRLDIAKIMAAANFKCGAEIGIAKATHACQLLNAIPGLHLYCIDPWYEYKPGKPSMDWAETRSKERTMTIAKRRLSKYNVTIIEKASVDALNNIKNESLDFVYIDGAHDFDNVMRDLIEWTKKVRTGGIVAGHDYCEFYRGGVIAAVNAYINAHSIVEWYVTKEEVPSYFWVKK